MQTPKARNSLEAPKKVSPRAVRQLKTTAADSDSVSSSSQASRTPKERSLKVDERKSPRSPASEKKRPSRISELESQVSQLQEDLKKTKDKLASSESWKKQAQQEAEEAQNQIAALSLKLEESQQQILALSSSEETHVAKLAEISQDEKKLTWESDLVSAREEIERLKLELEMVAKSECEQRKSVESTAVELHNLKGNLAETLFLVENMKMELKDCKESEAQAKGVVNETLKQLGTAKGTVESLRLEGMKASEAYNLVVSELEQSNARLKLLEGHVSKLEADLSQNLQEQKTGEILKCGEANGWEDELNFLKADVERLRTELENAERRHSEEKVKDMEELKSIRDLMEQMIFNSGLREAEVATELEKAKDRIEELKANLMDKETELQGIVEENEGLRLKLEKNLSLERESKLEAELKKLEEEFSELKASLMDKETELQSVLEENEYIKLEIEKRNENAESKGELEVAREAEREAVIKAGILMEEMEKSKARAARVAEQLEAAQASGAEMEAELRRLKVQSDQWRKAAEAAAAMLSVGTNGKFMDRTASLDSCYNPGRRGSPYGEDEDDDVMKKKNMNVLKKFGVLWKKQQK